MPTLMRGVGRAPDAPAPPGYRRAVAAHLYDRNSARIFKGQLPPMLYAIGVLQVDIDRRGQVGRMHWLRAPTHVPEVVAEIERIVRQSAPYHTPPGAVVTYTDTWLWDRSGRFQLDTLSEGQMS
jgi:periplasmic protein TonB